MSEGTVWATGARPDGAPGNCPEHPTEGPLQGEEPGVTHSSESSEGWSRAPRPATCRLPSGRRQQVQQWDSWVLVVPSLRSQGCVCGGRSRTMAATWPNVLAEFWQ